MRILHKYVVHSHPDNWTEGTWFDKHRDAADFMLCESSDGGACMTEVAYTFEDAQLIQDTTGRNRQ